jgi:hypothetical protein
MKWRKHHGAEVREVSTKTDFHGIEAFVDDDYGGLHQLADLRPWEMSPTTCHRWEPARGETPQDYRGRPWFASWWKAMALREKLQQLAAKENIKPSRATQLRKARKEQEELAEQEGDQSRRPAQLSTVSCFMLDLASRRETERSGHAGENFHQLSA